MKDEYLSAGSIIKKFIEVRGTTAKQVAASIDMPYTTFNGLLNRDSIDVYLLFRLKRILDIDLDWMATMLEYGKGVSTLEPIIIPRMQDELRNHEISKAQPEIDALIQENFDSISTARNELLKMYNTYFLLDLILPEDYLILASYDRQKTKYWCFLSNSINGGRRRITQIPAREYIDRYIAERKYK